MTAWKKTQREIDRRIEEAKTATPPGACPMVDLTDVPQATLREIVEQERAEREAARQRWETIERLREKAASYRRIAKQKRSGEKPDLKAAEAAEEKANALTAEADALANGETT